MCETSDYDFPCVCLSVCVSFPMPFEIVMSYIVGSSFLGLDAFKKNSIELLSENL